MDAKHGTHGRTNPLDPSAVVIFNDNTDYGLSPDEEMCICRTLSNQPLYWHDIECRYWCYDFEAANHWVSLMGIEECETEDGRSYQRWHLEVFD